VSDADARRRSIRNLESAASSNGLISLVGEIFLLPLRTVLYGMEMLLDTMRGMPRTGDREASAASAEPLSTAREPWSPRPLSSATAPAPCSVAAPQPEPKETPMLDKDLSDANVLKLVRYKILFIKRDYEHAFPEQEDLVSDPMDDSAFTAWKIAEFIQTLGRGEVPIPRKWADEYPHQAEYRKGGKLLGLDDGDKKYLRVYFEVLDRFPREKFKHDEEQIKVLKKIHGTLQESSVTQQEIKRGISG
jgi:hypothetical protein